MIYISRLNYHEKLNSFQDIKRQAPAEQRVQNLPDLNMILSLSFLVAKCLKIIAGRGLLIWKLSKILSRFKYYAFLFLLRSLVLLFVEQSKETINENDK